MGGLSLFLKRGKLLRTLLGDDPEARSSAAKELAGLGWVPTAPEEKAACLVGDWKLDDAAALGSVAVRFLGQSMVKANPRTRVKIAELLGQLGDSTAVPYLIEAIREGDCWVAMDGSFLATEASRAAVERMGSIFGGLGNIGGMIDLGGARVEVRKACEEALVAISRSGADILPQMAQLRESGAPWVRESLANVAETISRA